MVTTHSTRRSGVIDVGSNSVRLVVFDGAERTPAYFYNEKVICGLGRGAKRSGYLNPEGKQRALTALHRFKILSEQMQLDSLMAVATAAVREAQDGAAFCETVQKEFGINLVPITGEEEARLAANGIKMGWPFATGLVVDLGGSSMELADLKNGEIGNKITSALGPLSVLDVSDDVSVQSDEIDRVLDTILVPFSQKQDRLFLIGGALRTIAKFHIETTHYPLSVLNDYTLSRETLLKTIKHISTLNSDELFALIPSSAARINLLPTVTLVLKKLLERLDVTHVSFSSYGLREGIVFDNMPADLQPKAPLLVACSDWEERRARFPRFSAALFEWLKELFGHFDDEKTRLVQAACMLHDVNWAVHPDYRALACFENTVYANFGGITHQGRVFLAWALMRRYKSKHVLQDYQAFCDILSEADQRDADALGRALRLGAMMAGADPKHLGKISRVQDRIILELPSASRDMIGEIVMKRFEDLASILECEAQLRFSE